VAVSEIMLAVIRVMPGLAAVIPGKMAAVVVVTVS
jgi:hypothetical protein